ncbi:MAG: NAD(P)H-dependent oxidoreductase [Treponemataceae bacterium]|nr:NAD(P)H-dependent oxidoreductase [Treponemataceae bacterium]
MNILVINGSPKGEKSNTIRLTDGFLEGIKAGELKKGCPAPEIQVIEISRLNIKPCLGCFACWKNTPGKCCIHDDMASVIEKLLWADLTVWSFPLYYFGLPGQLKNLVDRQLPMNLPFMESGTKSGGHPSRFDMSGKKSVVISTCGFYTAKGNYDCVTAMFDRICGKDGYTGIFCGQGELFRVKELHARTDEYISYVKTAGEEFSLGKISAETWQKLDEILYPRDVFEKMADSSWGVSKNGEKTDESSVFTRQMAALYNKEKWRGKDFVLEMNYTDIGKSYRIILGKEGSRVTDELSGAFTTRINTPFSVWKAIASGEMRGDEAMMKHLYTVDGDFDLMLHWNEFFGGERETAVSGASAGSGGTAGSGGAANGNGGGRKGAAAKTNMNMILIPWIVFWVASSISSFWGSLASIGTVVLLPVLMCRTKVTVYDKLAGFEVGFCSLAMIAGVSPTLIIPLSYFVFGLMWSLSCFAKVPLTACYSMNSYNGESALQNPLFIRTNRILTAVWGIFYLISPVWTYFVMKTDFGRFIGAINSLLPLLIGIFTLWFQKWYPKHVASGK